MSDSAHRDVFERQAAAYVCGELEDGERAEFEEHLRTDQELRACVQNLQVVAERLEESSAVLPEVDVTAAVLDRIDAMASCRTSRSWWGVAAAAAAGFVVTLGVIALLTRGESTVPRTTRSLVVAEGSPYGAVRDQALKWLVATQEKDGSWNPANWDGQEEFRTGLTGLGIMAIVRNGLTPGTDQRRQAVASAVEYLRGVQRDDGCFGRGGLCNHGIATSALLEAFATNSYPELAAPIDTALAYAVTTQRSSGGWGSALVGGPLSSWESAWQLSTLMLARKQGFVVEGGVLQQGLAWITGVVPEGPRIARLSGTRGISGDALVAMTSFCVLAAPKEYPGLWVVRRQVLPALRASARSLDHGVDFHRWFFVAGCVRAGECPELEPWLEELQAHLVARCTRQGELAGSWDPVGRFAAVGGRLYTTIMATLLLEPIHDPGVFFRSSDVHADSRES